MRLADKIKYKGMSFLSNSGGIIIPNFFVGAYEMDLCQITRAGLMVEYEIKISRSDFFNDFKKGNKHDVIKSGSRCNRFFFITPRGLLNLNEIPPQYGLIEYDNQFNTMCIIKPAKILSKIDFVNWRSISFQLLSRSENYRRKYKYEKYLNQQNNTNQ
jgi:hypothetical protein